MGSSPRSWLASYVSYATSLKPVANVPADGRQLEPELGRQVELGVRFEPLAGRVSVNVAAYQINKENVVIARPMMIFDQAGEQRSRGAEIDAAVNLGPARINAGYAYTKAEFLRFESGGRDLTGNRPNLVSDHSASLWTTFRLKYGLRAGIGGRLLGKSYADPENTVPMAAYFVADLALSYEVAPATFTLNVYNMFEKNPFDSQGRYYTSAINGSQLTPGPPRTALAQLRLAF